MSENTTFELQVKQGDQWTIHENYLGDQRDEAISEAKKLVKDLGNIEAVRVVAESLDEETGIFSDVVIFKDFKPKKPVVKQVRRGGHARPSTSSETRGKAPQAAKKSERISLSSVIIKLLGVVLFCLGLAGVLAFMASEILSGTRIFGVRIAGNNQTNLLIGVFIVTFLISAFGMTVTVMKGVRLKKTQQSRFLAWIFGMLARAEQRGAQRRAAREAAARARTATRRVQAPPEPSQPDPAPEQPVPEEAPEAKPEDANELSETAEKLKVYMQNFLTESLKGSKASIEELDNFNRFGLSMYLAGACEILTQQGNMDPESKLKILSRGVETLGFKKSHAASFSQRYEEYLMADARYMQMFQSGRNSINIYLHDEAQGPRLLENALNEWNKPKVKEEQAGPVTVLFTDIAGSTAMTQTLGDEGAQQVIRAHNRIVREALSANAGKEIKHTGDGIMASFNMTSDGVDAAIEMQRETALHNQQNPNLPLHLKIGLNAGEPIAEDNDLFGTVVQLSARIVDKASADEIYISEIVRGICAGKDYNFVKSGDFDMKGFSDLITLYEVKWDETEGVEDAPVTEPQAEETDPPQETPPPEQATPDAEEDAT